MLPHGGRPRPLPPAQGRADRSEGDRGRLQNRRVGRREGTVSRFPLPGGRGRGATVRLPHAQAQPGDGPGTVSCRRKERDRHLRPPPPPPRAGGAPPLLPPHPPPP